TPPGLTMRALLLIILPLTVSVPLIAVVSEKVAEGDDPLTKLPDTATLPPALIVKCPIPWDRAPALTAALLMERLLITVSDPFTFREVYGGSVAAVVPL